MSIIILIHIMDVIDTACKNSGKSSGYVIPWFMCQNL